MMKWPDAKCDDIQGLVRFVLQQVGTRSKLGLPTDRIISQCQHERRNLLSAASPDIPAVAVYLAPPLKLRV
jgi:hypothetical protein